MIKSELTINAVAECHSFLHVYTFYEQNGYILVIFEVFMAVIIKNGVFWDVTPCGFTRATRRNIPEAILDIFLVAYLKKSERFKSQCSAFERKCYYITTCHIMEWIYKARNIL
jgi:hypothetical protein